MRFTTMIFAKSLPLRGFITDSFQSRPNCLFILLGYIYTPLQSAIAIAESCFYWAKERS